MRCLANAHMSRWREAVNSVFPIKGSPTAVNTLQDPQMVETGKSSVTGPLMALKNSFWCPLLVVPAKFAQWQGPLQQGTLSSQITSALTHVHWPSNTFWSLFNLCQASGHSALGLLTSMGTTTGGDLEELLPMSTISGSYTMCTVVVSSQMGKC